MAQAVTIAERAGASPARADTAEGTTRPYHTQVAGILASAFTISIGYTFYNSIAGMPHGASDARDPVLWLLYAIGFGLVALVRRNARWSWRTVAVVVAALIGIGLFYYPTLFTPEVQRPLGWVENDLYMGLLILAEYLCIQRLRRITLAPGE